MFPSKCMYPASTLYWDRDGYCNCCFMYIVNFCDMYCFCRLVASYKYFKFLSVKVFHQINIHIQCHAEKHLCRDVQTFGPPGCVTWSVARYVNYTCILYTLRNTLDVQVCHLLWLLCLVGPAHDIICVPLPLEVGHPCINCFMTMHEYICFKFVTSVCMSVLYTVHILCTFEFVCEIREEQLMLQTFFPCKVTRMTAH